MQGLFVSPSQCRDYRALTGKDRVLLGIWLTPDSRVYFYHPSGQIGPWKRRVWSPMTHFRKVKCSAQQLFSVLFYFMQITGRERQAMLELLKDSPGWDLQNMDFKQSKWIILQRLKYICLVSSARCLSRLLFNEGVCVTCLTLSDGLVDCMDPDCCLQATCHTTSLCVGSPDPLDIIQETQMSSTQSNLRTFYDRVHFLVGRDSTHIIPGANPFDGKWVKAPSATFCNKFLFSWEEISAVNSELNYPFSALSFVSRASVSCDSYIFSWVS